MLFALTASLHAQGILTVTPGRTANTTAGTGAAGYTGDTGPATAATLSTPAAVAYDTLGNLYIADANNHVIREISTTGIITTIAGTGIEGYSGDGAAATSAQLDTPTGIAVDASGNLYIADRLNQRIREVSNGIITTLAGTSTAGFSGDGAAATAATLSKPSGVSVDAAGNVYIADTDNQRIREVGGGAIATIEGSNSQGFGGDAGLSTAAILNSPRSVAPDALGNLSIADRLNQRIRSGALPTLTFPAEVVGVPSPTQTVTLTDTGTAAITVSAITPGPGFTIATGGSCPALPITLSAGASCTENIAFLPITAGSASGSVVFSGTGVVPQSILLTGSATPASTTLALTSNANPSLAGQPITYTASVNALGLGTPTGTVAFDVSGAAFNTQTLAPGSATATATISALTTGTDSFTAVYSGDANFTGSTSSTLPQLVEDFSLTQPNNPAGATGQTVIPGNAATFDLTLTPLLRPFNFPIVLSATGLPPGATVTFSPQTSTPGTSPSNFTMTIKTAVNQGLLNPKKAFGDGAMAFAFLLFPFTLRLRRCVRQRKRLRRMSLAVTLLLCVAALGSITGCGTDTGFFAQPQQTYTITVTGTAAGSNGYVLQHSTSVPLVVQ